MAIYMLSAREVQVARDGDHADGGGLVLRVRGGRAIWLLRYTGLDGRRHDMGLGSAHRDSTATAGESLTRVRIRARRALDSLAAGKDPLEAKRADRAAAAAERAAEKAARRAEQLTLCRAARGYHERSIEPRFSEKHAKLWLSSLERNVPEVIWQAPIDSLRPAQLLDALADLRKRIPDTADKVCQRLHAVFDDAIFYGHCAANPIQVIRRKLSETPRGRKEGHFAALPYVEVPAFVAELRRLTGTAARALEFALLTAARTGEVLGATWEELDRAMGVWRVPDWRMKGGEEHTVHLPARALEILAEVRALQGTYVFPSPRRGDRRMSSMAMLQLLKRMKMDDRTTVHGVCRASFSSWANETGVARPDVIEAALAHKEADRIRAAYNRAEHFAARAALLRSWADFVGGSSSEQRNVAPPTEPLRLVVA